MLRNLVQAGVRKNRIETNMKHEMGAVALRV